MKVRAIEAAKRRGQRRAIVALARRLAVIMPRMWTDGTNFRWARQASRTARAATEKKKGREKVKGEDCEIRPGG